MDNENEMSLDNPFLNKKNSDISMKRLPSLAVEAGSCTFLIDSEKSLPLTPAVFIV